MISLNSSLEFDASLARLSSVPKEHDFFSLFFV